MSRHKFTRYEQLRAAEGALDSPKTPQQLRDSLRLRARKLRQQIANEKGRRSSALFRFTGFSKERK
jgi:hypothetical protein